MCRSAVLSSCLRLVLFLVCLFLSTLPAAAKTYRTSFLLTENPLSENGAWINGKVVGLDWADIQTKAGCAFGTQIGNEKRDNDSTALLAGIWGPDQTAQAVVHSFNQHSNVWEEVEIRLRSTLTSNSCKGYEINFRCAHDGSQYIEIVRWNGPVDDFTYLAKLMGGPGIHTGDVVAAKIVGTKISAFVNGICILSTTDARFSNGSPGIGFYLTLRGNSGSAGDYGFSFFTATDEPVELLLPHQVLKAVPVALKSRPASPWQSSRVIRQRIQIRTQTVGQDLGRQAGERT